jgi:hypothetical protein
LNRQHLETIEQRLVNLDRGLFEEDLFFGREYGKWHFGGHKPGR